MCEELFRYIITAFVKTVTRWDLKIASFCLLAWQRVPRSDWQQLSGKQSSGSNAALALLPCPPTLWSPPQMEFNLHFECQQSSCFHTFPLKTKAEWVSSHKKKKKKIQTCLWSLIQSLPLFSFDLFSFHFFFWREENQEMHYIITQLSNPHKVVFNVCVDKFEKKAMTFREVANEWEPYAHMCAHGKEQNI